jgi:protein O-GlcNAc transferase
MAALRSGDTARAQALCDALLAVNPAHAEALRLSGLLACEAGGYERALSFFSRSLESDPQQAVTHANVGAALLMLGRTREALMHCDRALTLQPGCAEAHYSRGCALAQLGRAAEAIAAFDAALAAMPRMLPALINRGNVLHGLARLEAALESFERALRLDPADPGALYNRGNVLKDLGRLEEALESYDRVLAQNRRSVELLNNRGNVLRELGRRGAALEAYEQALQLQPDAVEPLNNRGTVLLDLGRVREALACFERVLRLKPDFAVALDNYATALRIDARPEEAARTYAELLRVAPQFKGVRTNLHHARALCCDWSGHAASVAAVVESMRAGAPGNPLLQLAVSDDVALQRRSAAAFAAAEGWSAARAPLWRGERYGHERLRLAYVSADLCEHPVSYLLAGVLEQHDRGRFETIAVALRPAQPSPFGERVRRAFDRFIDVSSMSDPEIATLLRGLEVDIAVDLMGYTHHGRPGVLARRPAPLQVNYLGYPGGMGVPFIDYLIADRFVIPPATAAGYQEQIVFLPECFQPNDDLREIAGVPPREAAGLPAQGLVLCSFNNSYKLNPTMFGIWMRVLRAVPGSVLWLAPDSPTAADNLRREAAQRGVDPQRLVLGRRLPYAEHLARLAHADLFLDTLPFNAGTTASDALWAGVPVLTCAGEAFAARMAASLLKAAGLPELITYNLEDYERVALDLALRPERLAALRARLAADRGSCALFATARYCRHLEAAYAAMQARHERGEPAAPLLIEPLA